MSQLCRWKLLSFIVKVLDFKIGNVHSVLSSIGHLKNALMRQWTAAYCVLIILPMKNISLCPQSSGMIRCCSESFTSSAWKEGVKQFKKLLVIQGKDRTGS